MKTTMDKFILINFVEGISFLILLFIAMPLKYMFDYPVATKIFGMIHGILFIMFLILLSQAIQKYKFSLKFSLILFIASLIPFGTTWTDKKLKQYKV
jgi:integral membrane protein